ncbi:MAG TPA: DUF4062 domain-containing protein [Blastocatellia bacterium]|nr:DUF4062 domain-containing protein [Blastocatellia bacterium]
MARVYVSSTFIDLQECREQVRLVLRRMGHEDVAMEYYVAEDKRPVDKCLADVASCDLYVGIFAWRYGWVPATSNPAELSITEMEYRRAVEARKTCLIFLLDEDAPWPRKLMDRDQERIERLRAELQQRHLPAYFESAKHIGSVVAPAIYQWAKEHGHVAPGVLIPEFDLNEYYSAVRKRYQRLDLEGLTPPQKEEYLQLQLRSIFVEQSVREDPPPVELSKEAVERLRREKEIHADDLPEGFSIDEIHRAREAYFERPARLVLDVLTDSRHNTRPSWEIPVRASRHFRVTFSCF